MIRCLQCSKKLTESAYMQDVVQVTRTVVNAWPDGTAAGSTPFAGTFCSMICAHTYIGEAILDEHETGELIG